MIRIYHRNILVHNMNKLFIAQNLGGGKNLFQYKTINVIVDDFGGQRAAGYEGTLLATPNT